MIVEEFLMMNELSNSRSDLMDVFHNILLTNKDLILKKKLIPQEGINCLRTLDSFV